MGIPDRPQTQPGEKPRPLTLAQRVALQPRSPIAALVGSIAPLVVGILLAFVLQAVVAPMLGDYWAKILMNVGIAIVLAVSLNIVNGFTGQFSLGHAGFMLIGGYAAAIITYYGSVKLFGTSELVVTSPALIEKLGGTPCTVFQPEPLPAGCDEALYPLGGFLGSGDLLFLGACVVGGLVAALAGVAVGLPSLRLRGDYLAIVTLGFGEIVRVLVTLSDDVLYADQVADVSMLSVIDNIGGTAGFTPKPPTFVSPTPWKETTGHAGIFFVFCFVALVCICAYRLKVSSKGRQLLAVRENEIAAEATGVDTSRVKVSAFVLAAFFGGIGGALFAHGFGENLSPKNLDFQKSIDLVIIVVLGGMGSISGVIAAATILTVLPEIFRDFAQYRMVFFALALVVVMIVRPQGLMGIRELWELAAWRKTIGAAYEKLIAKLGSLVPGRAPASSPPPPPPVDTGKPALEVKQVSIAFGGLKAVTDFTLSLPVRGLHGLIGPNGAGKTTVFNLLTGVYRAQSGEIRLLDRRVDGKRPNVIARGGMARTFQNIRLFGELSVLDNVRTAAGVRAKSGLFRSLERTPLYLAEERAIVERSMDLLKVLGIAHRAHEQAKSLPYGDQRRLEIARALATEPKVLLLDEPVAGMNNREKREMAALISSLRDRFDVAILLIEHDMGLVMEICEHITVIDHGVTIAAGKPADVQSDPRVIEAYLGVPDDDPGNDLPQGEVPKAPRAPAPVVPEDGPKVGAGGDSNDGDDR